MPNRSLGKSARQRLDRARKLLTELISKIRLTREKLWEEKLASRP